MGKKINFKHQEFVICDRQCKSEIKIQSVAMNAIRIITRQII